MRDALVVTAARRRLGGREVLRGLDLAVARGEVAAVLGASGCGKTTLLRVVAGFEPLDAGTVAVAGAVVTAPGRRTAPERRAVGYVPQEGALFPHLSVGRNVGFGLGRGRGGRAARERVAHVLELVGLPGAADAAPHELSGGQQQRVAVARALAPRPALVLLDEPFSALDAGLREEVRGVVRAALRADGATAVLVTHDREEALGWADHLAVMVDGAVAQSGTPEQVHGQPASPVVARFLGAGALLPAVLDRGRARTSAGVLEARGAVVDGPATVLVRADQVVVHAADDAAARGVPATVVGQRFRGADALVTARPASGPPLDAVVPPGAAAAPGSRVRVEVRGAVLVWPDPAAGSGR
ncbi:ABC transporter ATP-binding protein [Pseudokineococcus lusitanus]|uniref:ABC-type quaternary amine transporter n=1 Tax=Pseudokineococcus lusitanus TaxID=763993 RepID=A0A3N1HR32_9ACTN|nr:ABC transporter ATP-binding protein [Pseudokineococcus lusitanus]ROP44965.1 iron(III) transport system ATP-binding protein [Pseudokineococcus lusitanus]